MKKIPLTKGKFAIVDAKNFEWLNQWKWSAQQIGVNYYAVRCVNRKNEKRIFIFMHRLIFNLQIGDGIKIDHINGESFDNRECNLRICSQKQNVINRHKVRGISQYKGVTRHKRKWRAQIKLDGKTKHLGLFNNELDAGAAYDLAALKYFGEFSFTNFEKALVA